MTECSVVYWWRATLHQHWTWSHATQLLVPCTELANLTIAVDVLSTANSYASRINRRILRRRGCMCACADKQEVVRWAVAKVSPMPWFSTAWVEILWFVGDLFMFSIQAKFSNLFFQLRNGHYSKYTCLWTTLRTRRRRYNAEELHPDVY
jgi:hypothetical protein